MRKQILLLIAVFCVSVSNAQYVGSSEIPLDRFTVLDSAQMKFTYLFKYKKSYYNDDADSCALAEDKQNLVIGNGVSKYYSEYYFDYCEREMRPRVTGEPSVELKRGACSFEIFKNYPETKMTVTDQSGVNAFGGNYKYIENIPAIEWNIQNDTTTILAYLCQKATTTFRGRNYTAWFAPEIPSNNGPWKFGGLPGLILKISDESQRYIFECIGIQNLDKPELIKFYKLKYTLLNRKELDKIYRRFFKDPIQFWNDVLSEIRGQITASDLPKMKYDPIELE